MLREASCPRSQKEVFLILSYLNYMQMYLHTFVNIASFLTSVSASPSTLLLFLPTSWKWDAFLVSATTSLAFIGLEL